MKNQEKNNTIKIATWNINSIRARIPRVIEWIKEENPDILLLQELKCTEDQFPFLEFASFNYNIEMVCEKARNGVAILSKFPLYDVKKALPLYDIVEKDESARYIEAYFDYNGKTVKIASIYLPNGAPTVLEERNGYPDITETETFYNKMKFCDRLRLHFQEHIKNDEIAIFGGDYNVCPVLEMDVYSTKKDGSITNTYKERDKFKSFLDTGMVDVWRKLNPNLREYSWWGYRPIFMWEKNQGYRLDALLTTEKASKLINYCKIYSKETRGKEKASDHAPMMCELAL